MRGPRLLPLGDSGLVAEFGGDIISEEASDAVRALDQAVRGRLPGGMIEAIPTYRSLLIVYDPLRATAADIRRAIAEASARADPGRLPPGRLVEIPTVYGGPFGPDLASVAAEVALPESQVVALHAGREYRIYMLGFTPGFPYMGTLDPRLHVSRLPSPRTHVPGRSVAVAGQQTGVYPIDSPGGWRLIGRTPLRIYDPERPTPFLLDVGDRARFVSISAAEYERRDNPDSAPVPPSSPRRTALVVEEGGLFTTIQDQGRPGYRRYGLPQGGAMDPLALAITNLLLGNPPGAAAVEFTLPGPRLVAVRRVAVALGGADQTPTLNGRAIPMWTALTLREGDVLSFGAPGAGQWTYLAVSGGVDVPAVLGSRSTYVRAALAGYNGRRLQSGDHLACVWADPRTLLRLPASSWPQFGGDCDLRTVRGPQAEYFTEEALRMLFGEAWRISTRTDRLGYRLDGPRLAHRAQAELLSDGLLPGAIQVPSGGQPIVLMADGPTTGGYPKIGAVVRADVRRLAQARRDQGIRFREVVWDDAHLAAREEAAYLAGLRLERVT